MASSNFENIAQLLLINDFKEEIPIKFHCIICQNVSIEMFKTYCKCRLCSNCIKNHLKDGNKYCPGIKNECREEYLEIDVNVSKDISSFRSIEKISVTCPNEMCKIKCEVKSMNEHLRVCGMSTTKCPYENIGCQERQICKDNVKIHYDNEWLTHSQLIVEAIANLRNDVNELRNVVARRDEQIITLNDKDARNEIMIMKMNQQIEDQRRKIDVLKDECGKQANEMEVMREDLRMKEEMINEIKQQINNERKEIDELKIKDEQRNKDESDTKYSEEEDDNLKTDMKEDIKDLKVNLNNIESEISSVIMKVRDSRIYDEREFLWRVNNFSKMKDYGEERKVILWRYSLKFCLSLQCYRDSIWFRCGIMKGEFDNNINWPMKHKITLSMINQNTIKSRTSRHYDYDSSEGDKSAFDKPKNKWNDFSIGDLFMTAKDIIDSPGLLLNDSLIVSFNIEY